MCSEAVARAGAIDEVNAEAVLTKTETDADAKTSPAEAETLEREDTVQKHVLPSTGGALMKL